MSRFRFQIAEPGDDAELREFGRSVSMPGAIQLASEREPSYLDALSVEGRHREALICREAETGRVLAIGNRSIKPLFVNGQPAEVGYLSGLRIGELARGGRVLVDGYKFLRQRHQDGRAQFYLTTIMEDNAAALDVFGTARHGLPSYHDYGKFCSMALSLRPKTDSVMPAGLCIRPATVADAPLVIDHLRREGSKRQFFPDYAKEDFADGGLLRGLAWSDVFLAFRGTELVGTTAAWDQRAFRQWKVTGYAGWFHWLRTPYNLLARLSGAPRLPVAGAALKFFVFSLVCVHDDDCTVFSALIDEAIRTKGAGYAFVLAGLHERDPLLPELQRRRHISFPSRLHVVCWEDGEESFRNLDRRMIPHLELGSL